MKGVGNGASKNLNSNLGEANNQNQNSNNPPKVVDTKLSPPLIVANTDP